MGAQVTSAATAPELQQSILFAQPMGISTETVVVDLQGRPISSKPAKPRDWIRSSLDGILALQSDWDGYGADPISATTVAVIESLLRQLLPPNASMGSIVPGADGSLQAEWHLHRVEFGLLLEVGEPISAWVFPRGGVEVERTGLAALELFSAVAQFELA